jgi:hypothetical protein
LVLSIAVPLTQGQPTYTFDHSQLPPATVFRGNNPGGGVTNGGGLGDTPMLQLQGQPGVYVMQNSTDLSAWNAA